MTPHDEFEQVLSSAMRHWPVPAGPGDLAARAMDRAREGEAADCRARRWGGLVRCVNLAGVVGIVVLLVLVFRGAGLSGSLADLLDIRPGMEELYENDPPDVADAIDQTDLLSVFGTILLAALVCLGIERSLASRRIVAVPWGHPPAAT